MINLDYIIEKCLDILIVFIVIEVRLKKINYDHLGTIRGEMVHISNREVSDNRLARKCGKTLHIGYIASSEYFKGFSILKVALDAFYMEGLKILSVMCMTNLKDMKIPYF